MMAKVPLVPVFKSLLFCTLFLVIFFGGCNQVKALDIKEPEYFIALDMQQTARVVVVNGILLEQDYEGSSNSTKYPINHIIRNGKNTVEIVYGPKDFMQSLMDENSKNKVSILVRGTVGDKKVEYVVTTLEYTPIYSENESDLYKNSSPAGSFTFESDGSVVKSENGKDAIVGEVKILPDYFYGVSGEEGGRISRTFVANVPFPEWAFFSAEKIFSYPMSDEKYAILEKDVWPELIKLWDMADKKDIDGLLKAFEFRSKELDQAFYYQPGFMISEIENGLKRIMFKEKLPLDRVENDYMQMIVHFNGRLVKIVNAGSGNGSIMFYNKGSDSQTFYDVEWIKKDGQWIIGR